VEVEVTSDGVVVGAAGDCAGENREWVVEGHGRRDADADGVAGAAVDAEDDAARARARALVQVPHLPPRAPLHLPLFLHLTLLHTLEREKDPCFCLMDPLRLPAAGQPAAEVSAAPYICTECVLGVCVVAVVRMFSGAGRDAEEDDTGNAGEFRRAAVRTRVQLRVRTTCVSLGASAGSPCDSDGPACFCLSLRCAGNGRFRFTVGRYREPTDVTEC
jgi:hypothetical protein